jgi:hypothetical protein
MRPITRPARHLFWEYLLTKHWFSREIADLPDREIERLRGMLSEAVQQRIEPKKVYEAITLGFERTLGITVSSPPLASDDLQPAGKSKEEALLALVRELDETC